ncbi:ABC transporter ATP-binding protein [Caldicellulosiruptoraceae bacterium PP1]
MSQKYAVEIQNVSMRFNLGNEKIDSLKEYFVKLITRKLYFQEFWALQDISLNIKKGEVFGLIGLNGAGKSTLLKVIAGVLKPTKGKVIVRGSMAPLIELGAGFDYDLTARENIFLNGAILGHSRRFMKEKFDEIVEFSELKDFLDVPIKNFSSGMQARLGFAIATIVEPEILIVDEILAVGDFHFQEKCENKIKKMIDNGVTIIMVSHSIEQIERMCKRVAWLEKGKLKMIGHTKEICEVYKRS